MSFTRVKTQPWLVVSAHFRWTRCESDKFVELVTSTVYFTRRCREDPHRRCRINQFEWLRGGCGTHQLVKLVTNVGVVGGEGQEGIPEEV